MSAKLSETEMYLFHQGTFYHSYKMLGCHRTTDEGKDGYRFAVWAPRARSVHLAGDFTSWKEPAYPLEKANQNGLWVGFFDDIPANTPYKYLITPEQGVPFLKSDPYAFQTEVRPNTASLTPGALSHQWKDEKWYKQKQKYDPHHDPLLIYEVHLGSWRMKEDGTLYTYKELAKELIPYVKKLGYTHIELLPLAEHPLDLSWGYQITGYYSVTSRYGTPADFKYFVDVCHQSGIGVIMDWVPGHFNKDQPGLRLFDGSPVYEYSDPRKAEKRSWGTLTFDFGKPEVQSFLISNALYWLEEFHIDGLRVDAVASMLFLNFDKQEGEERITNTYGGEENLEAFAFLKKLNEAVFNHFPTALMMAEDSSDLPDVSTPVSEGGLGFNFKWNMGWMNDMLTYMAYDPVYRKWHHNLLTFSLVYTYNEHFVLPFSHDEVVHGKKSMLNKMPGDQWQQFANLRLLYGYMIAHPGKKLLFMGGEFGQYIEWRDQEELDWLLLDYPMHRQLYDYVKKLNHFYSDEPALYQLDHEPAGFEWIDPNNSEQSIIAFKRKTKKAGEELTVICNFTPNVYYNYKVGVSYPGKYKEVFNSDWAEFGGSDQVNSNNHFTFPEEWHNHHQYIKVKIPPLAISVFKKVAEKNPTGEETK